MVQVNQQTVVSVKNATKSFQSNKIKIDALKNVSLSVYAGEILSILGPNGAGKTTLINTMLGKLSLSSGEINLLGLKPGQAELKRQCGAMLQVSGLPDMSTIKEHIELFQSYYAEPMAYEKVVSIAGLKELENQFSKNLSGGQKQRLLFALAICGNPKLLFLDEPTVGMDITARRSLWSAIKDLKAQGTSVILTTHYLEEADQLSDRIIMLNQGEVIKTGTPEEIKSQVDNKAVSFISDVDPKLIKQLPSVNQISITEKSNNKTLLEIQTDNPVTTLKSIFDLNIEISDLSV
ncbi:MAG: ABC transporter ATP-binding protein, partial [Kangiellaceae bacterium]